MNDKTVLDPITKKIVKIKRPKMKMGGGWRKTDPSTGKITDSSNKEEIGTINKMLNKKSNKTLTDSHIVESVAKFMDGNRNIHEADAKEWKYEDVIDTRELEERLQELQDSGEDNDEFKMIQNIKNFFIQEYQNGKSAWEDGFSLIRESYLTDYLQEQFEDIYSDKIEQMGDMYHYIDWDKYANDRKIDTLSSIEIDDIDYYFDHNLV